MGRDRERYGGIGIGGKGEGEVGRNSERWEGRGRGGKGQVGRDRERWEGTGGEGQREMVSLSFWKLPR